MNENNTGTSAAHLMEEGTASTVHVARTLCSSSVEGSLLGNKNISPHSNGVDIDEEGPVDQDAADIGQQGSVNQPRYVTTTATARSPTSKQQDCEQGFSIGSKTNENSRSTRRNMNNKKCIRFDRVWVFALLIVTVGVGVSCAFLVFGLNVAKDQERVDFERSAQELISSIEEAWDDFEVAGLYIHNACRAKSNPSATYLDRGICSRSEFSDLYETVKFSGLDVQAVSWAVNVTHEDRLDLEQEAYQYYADKNWTDFEYNGFMGFIPDPKSPKGVSMSPLPELDYYYAVHYTAPYTGYNLVSLDFDLRTSPPRRDAVENALRTRKPALTDRVVLLGDVAEVDGYSVIIMHPGKSNEEANGVSLIVVRIRSLLLRAARTHATRAKVVMFDTKLDTEPHFLGGLDIQVRDDGGRDTEYVFMSEMDIDSVRSADSLVREETVQIADRKWTILVNQDEDPNIVFVVIASVLIFMACVCLAVWYFSNARREERMHQMEAASEAEKAALILENAEKKAKHERELNDFVAHEIRNPLAAAISACSFVTAAVKEEPPLATKEATTSVREDLSIISSSLQYINSLLRNMLDMHKVASNEISVELSPADLKRDLLVPVAAMMHNRGENVETQVDCPEDLAVMTDKIRLKQVLLNLTSNARKFVIAGFIRIRASVIDEKIFIYIEDSGPGIPEAKRKHLWDKYQESGDSLNQGTGIGLSLCRDLVHLMNGDIWLDEEYHSGIAGCPGARFVINLNASPLDLQTSTLKSYEESTGGDGKSTLSSECSQQCFEKLPKHLRVLFCDDDLVLRKLFSRSVKRILPDWEIQESCNGELALEMTKAADFDIIFIDQYMASIEKQLLGTETCRALRANGVESIVCGLSANDVEEAFLNAGANCFMFKPFPCEKNELAQELNRILKGTGHLMNVDDEKDNDEVQAAYCNA